MRTRRISLLVAAAALYLTLSWRLLFWSSLVPVDGNVIAVTYPNWALARSLWESPRAPLWNPGRDMGVPHAADPITSALYPPMIALSAVPDFAFFLRAWVTLHTLLAAGFAAAWAWRRRRDGWPAAAAGLLAGFNGFFTSRVVFPHQFASAAWLPATLYFQEAGSAAGLGTALALQWLAGYPPFSLLTFLLLLVLGGRKRRDCLLRGCALALGLSAVQSLPFIEFLSLSTRGGLLPARAAAEYSLAPGQLFKELLLPLWSWLSPGVEGDPAIVGFYFGLPALALAAWGLRSRPAKTFTGLLAATLILSLGGHLPGYAWLKPLHLFRYPANWLLLACVGLFALCSEGVAALPSARWKAAAFVLVALDLLAFSQAPRVAWSRPELLTERPRLASLILAQPQPCRLYHDERLMRLWAAGTLESEEDYLLMRDFLAPDYGMTLGLQGVSDYQTLRLRSAEGFHLLDWAGACVIVDIDPAARRVERGLMRVRVNPQAKARVFVPNDPSASVRLESYAPGRARASVRLERAGDVVFAENRYPGWTAAVDGQAAPTKAFAGTFLSVDVPAGTHGVEFRFRAWSFWFGAAVSLITIFSLAAGWLRKKI